MGFFHVFYSIVLRILLKKYKQGALDYEDFNLIQDNRNLDTHKELDEKR